LPILNLPSKLKTIFFPPFSKFNQSIDNLPDSVETIILPTDYSEEIKKLPTNLKKMTIYDKYNILDMKKKFPELFENDIIIVKQRKNILNP